MGDPRKLRKKYETPIHPWKAESIELEKGLIKEYGLGNKKEIWKMNSILKKYKDLAKKLIAVKTKQGEKEKEQMLDKLRRWGLIEAGAELDDVLGLDVKDIMERRLQSLVFRNGLARSMEQARQFIVHRHVLVGDKKITFPSYIVSREEEGQIKFDGLSSLSEEEHPERVSLETTEKVVEEKEKKDKEATTSPKESSPLPQDVPSGVSHPDKGKPEEEKVEEKPEKEEKSKEEIPSAEEMIKETKEKFPEEKEKKFPKKKTAEEIIEETKEQ